MPETTPEDRWTDADTKDLDASLTRIAFLFSGLTGAYERLRDRVAELEADPAAMIRWMPGLPHAPIDAPFLFAVEAVGVPSDGRLEWRLDEADLGHDLSQITIDPADLEPGDHTIVAEIRAASGRTLDLTTARFVVAEPAAPTITLDVPSDFDLTEPQTVTATVTDAPEGAMV